MGVSFTPASCILPANRHLAADPSAVTKRIPEPRPELAPGIREHEARLLAMMLRNSRLTWVFAERGADKTELLSCGVLPLLQRRRDDRFGREQHGQLADGEHIERRRLAAKSGTWRSEVALFFYRWTEHCLDDLKAQIAHLVPTRSGGRDISRLRLADALEMLHQQFDVHPVLILDRFECFLDLRAHDHGPASFVDEFVEALQAPCASASFLVAMDERTLPRLRHFRDLIPDLDQNSLRLSPISGGAATTELSSTGPATAQSGKLLLPHAPMVRRAPNANNEGNNRASRLSTVRQAPLTVEQVYAFIEAKLSSTSSNSADVKPAVVDGEANAWPRPTAAVRKLT